MRAPGRADALDTLALAFDSRAADADPDHLPLLLRVEGDPHPPESVLLGERALHGEHPGPVLLGFTAPDAWSVLGVSSIGWSLPPERVGEADLDRNAFVGGRPSEAADRVRVRSTVLVDRAGTISGCLTVDDGETIVSAPSHGAMVDVLLRAMRCPTPPPAVSTTELFALAWLSEISAVGAVERRPLTWAAAARLHPGMRMLASDGMRLAADDVERVGRALGNVCGWDVLRWQVVEQGSGIAGCSRAEAAWFDDGSFARWAVSSYPPLPALVAEASRALVPSAVRRLRKVLRGWSLLG